MYTTFVLNYLLDFFFPRRSLTGKSGTFVTDLERELLLSFPVIEERTHLRKRGLKSLDHLIAASSYHHAPLLKKAIANFKYRRVHGLSAELAALLDCRMPMVKGDEDFCLCPVPLHWLRMLKRGFNQSEMLALSLADTRNLHVQNLLKRTRSTGHQAWRKKRERFLSMRDAFVCRVSSPPERVILIDDLSTTGATLDACAKALKNAGVKKVEGWVVAHG
jgi:ComF family protein